MLKINLNSPVLVKLTDHGKDVYYHQYDDLIARGIRGLTRAMPPADENGFTMFQLWHLIQLYGEHIGMALPNVFEDICIYLDEKELEQC